MFCTAWFCSTVHTRAYWYSNIFTREAIACLKESYLFPFFSLPVSMEELLEQQWDQSARFLMEQSQHFDGGWVYVQAGRHVCASVCMHMHVCRHVCVCGIEGVFMRVCVWRGGGGWERVCVCVTCLNKADSDPRFLMEQSQHFSGEWVYVRAGRRVCVWVHMHVCRHVCVLEREAVFVHVCVCVFVLPKRCVGPIVEGQHFQIVNLCCCLEWGEYSKVHTGQTVPKRRGKKILGICAKSILTLVKMLNFECVPLCLNCWEFSPAVLKIPGVCGPQGLELLVKRKLNNP